MIPQYMTRIGYGGNCYQACIASILELPLEDVPDMAPAMVETEGTDADWSVPLRLWLRGRGFGTAEWPGLGNVRMDGNRPTKDPSNAVVYTSGHRPAGWSILTGQSPRGPFLHAVVCYDGELKHDPFPGGGGVLSENSWEIIYALDPTVSVGTGAMGDH